MEMIPGRQLTKSHTSKSHQSDYNEFKGRTHRHRKLYNAVVQHESLSTQQKSPTEEELYDDRKHFLYCAEILPLSRRYIYQREVICDDKKLNKRIQRFEYDGECDCEDRTMDGHYKNDTNAQAKCSSKSLPPSLKQSVNVQLTAQQDDWLAMQSLCGGGNENKLTAESGIRPCLMYEHSTTTVKKVNAVTKGDSQILSFVNADSSITKSPKLKSIYNNRNFNYNKCNQRNISTHVTVSYLFKPAFSFLFLTTFLLSCFNYCDKVQGEIVLSMAQQPMFGSNNNLENLHGMNRGKTAQSKRLSLSAPQTLSSIQLSLPVNDNLEDSFKNTVVSEYANSRVNNNAIYSTSHGKSENIEGKFTDETTSSSTEINQATLRKLLLQPLERVDKTVLLKTVWDALTVEEIQSIFGHKISSAKSVPNTKAVPNFDITKPKFTLPSHNIKHNDRRKRQSPTKSDRTKIEELNDHEEMKKSIYQRPQKTIQLEGLGRQFTLNIHLNKNLLDADFVHLHRHKNRSEIIPPNLVRKQLKCFYHGTATHQDPQEFGVEEGAVALNLCGGMKGFILPGSLPTGTYDGGSPQFHYVIHPLPKRLWMSTIQSNGSADREKSKLFSSGSHAVDNEPHEHHHIIFRRRGSPVSELLPKPPPTSANKAAIKLLNIFQNDNIHDAAASSSETLHQVEKPTSQFAENDDEFSTCMHHERTSTTVSNGEESRIKNASKKFNGYSSNYQQVLNTRNAHDFGTGATANLETKLDRVNRVQTYDVSSKSQQADQMRHRMNPIFLSEPLADSAIKDQKSSAVKEGIPLSSPTFSRYNFVGNSTGRHFRRMKRSTITNFDTDTIDPFTYKPISIAPDSYWVRFRDRSGPNTATSPFANSNSRRLSSQFTYDSGIPNGPPKFSSSSSNPSFLPSNWHSNDKNPSSRHPNKHADSSQLYYSSRPVRQGSRYDEIMTSPEYDDTGTAGTDMTWSKGVLVFDSSTSFEDRHYPGRDVPFYTKHDKKMKGKGSSSSVAFSTSSTSAKTSSSNTRSFDWFGNDIMHGNKSTSATESQSLFSLNKNGTASKPYSLLDPPSRKGRRDDGVFGDKWKSSLDSEIIWADRSNEINKQSRFSDLSHVKDRPHSHLTIETAVFVDKDLYKHMQQNFPEDTQGEVTRIVLAMINAVQLLYQDPSLGHRVDFVLKRLEVLEEDPGTLIRPYDIDRFLTNFCKWQKTENPVSDADPLHWDHALILTGLDLYVVHQSGKISNQVVGLAPVAGMCTRSSSCTVNEGRHFESVFVVAHEIGHNLGMRHDGPQAENNCDPTSHIMSPTLGSGKITWSPCSKKYLDLFLETTQAKCLFDKGKSQHTLDHDADGRLPGERFDADRQCVLKYGRGSFHATQQPLEDVCRDLHCRREFFTWTSHPALDGTSCSVSDDMWCRAGKCVPKLAGPLTPLKPYGLSGLGRNNGKHDGFTGNSNSLSGSETAAYVTPKALDGGWGKWSPFTDCSSACLYSDDGKSPMGSTGIRLAARRCDSPRPENGGRQCSGADRRYKTCSTEKICIKNPTRTTISQYATEVCSRAAQVDTELTGRGYMSSSNDPDRACSVWCATSDKSGPRSRGWSFPDGTVCRLATLPQSAYTFCIAGKCQEFTCNPYSHFRLSEEDCTFSTNNDVFPSSNKNKNMETWIDGTGEGVKINHRSGKVGWTDWEAQTECKLACLAPARGLQLVKRQCASDDALCTGLSLSVRLCKPDKFSGQANGCSRLQTPFEYATKVCSKYAEKVSGLSGIGMQLSPNKDDPDRPCRVGCQDAAISYRFYMVNGEEGWFPAGTDCSRGDQERKAYCMAGKCVDFGNDNTPLYQLTSIVMGSIFHQSSKNGGRNKRQAVYNIMEPLNTEPGMDESSLKQLVQKFSRETGNYPSLVQRSERERDTIQRGNGNGGNSNSIDFSKPIMVPSSSSRLPYGRSIAQNLYNQDITRDSLKQTNALASKYFYNKNDYHDSSSFSGRSLNLDVIDDKQRESVAKKSSTYVNRLGQNSVDNYLKSQPIEGSFYEWRKIISDCSVVCGVGIQEQIVDCVSVSGVIVNEALCQGPRPGYSGYITCKKTDCAPANSVESNVNIGNNRGQGSVWNWIQSILPPKNISYTNGRSN